MNEQRGGLKNTLAAGFSAGKWRVQLVRLNSDQKRIESQKLKMLNDLGIRAWEAKVKHPLYEQAYTDLEEIDRQRIQVQSDLAAGQSETQKATQNLNTIKADFAARINDVQQQKQIALGHLNQIKNAQRTADEHLNQTINQQRKASTDLSTLQGQLAQISSGSAADKELRINNLNSAISALQTTINDTNTQIPAIKADIERQNQDQQPVLAEINSHEQQLARLQAEQTAAVEPVNKQITTLQAQIRTLNEKLVNLSNLLQKTSGDLGSAVNQARPANPALDPLYAQIDAAQRELNKAVGEVELCKARLSTIDSSTMRNFYWIVGGLVGGVVIIAGLIVVGIFLINNILMPTLAYNTVTAGQPQARDIKQIYSWSDKTCTSVDSVPIVNVWENNHNEILKVNLNNQLLGSNNTVLNERTSEMLLVPGGSGLDVLSIDRNGSRVNDYKSYVTSVYSPDYNMKSIALNGIQITPYIINPGNSQAAAFGLKIVNKSDFGITATSGQALILDDKDVPIAMLVANGTGNAIPVDKDGALAFLQIPFESGCSNQKQVNFAHLDSPVTVWYFFTYLVGTDKLGIKSDKVKYAP